MAKSASYTVASRVCQYSVTISAIEGRGVTRFVNCQ